MSGSWGRNTKLTIFGESHGPAVGMVLDGIMPGLKLDMDFIRSQMRRRAPGRDRLSTSRMEEDEVEFLSGIFDGNTTGTPIAMIIRNRNANPEDYSDQKKIFRPSHADHTGWTKYKGFNDSRGGGHFSGRLTAGIVCAGAIALQALEKNGIFLASQIVGVGSVKLRESKAIDITVEDLKKLRNMEFPVLDNELADRMQEEIIRAKLENDSVGGLVETVVIGVKSGFGDPFFDSVESVISSLLFSIPSVKGVEFGEGFNLAGMRGSQASDELFYNGNEISYYSNNNGGILGGITNGMPIVFRVSVKPTASIGQTQRTVDVESGKDTTFEIKGRHDPCIVRRIAPIIESAAAIGILDILAESKKWD